MYVVKSFAIVSISVVLHACQVSDPLPPVAKIEPVVLETHGETRTDNYYWLREREDPDVMAYLEAENRYREAVLSDTEPLQERLFGEIQGRIKQSDSSVPYKKGEYYYYHRFEEGREFPIYCRRESSLDASEQIMVDANELAEGNGFFSIRNLTVSPNQDLAAYAVDRQGRRFYSIHFKDLSTGDRSGKTIPRTTGDFVWANDNRTLFYTKQDSETLRPYQVYRHTLDSDANEDLLVYEEKDETFELDLSKTKSKKYILLASTQTLSTEYRYLDADKPSGEFVLVQPRERNHEYHIDHHRDSFYVRTNLEASNFRLMETPVDHPRKENWHEVISNRDDVFLEGFELFRNHLVLMERSKGILQLFVKPWGDEEGHYIEFEEPLCEVYPVDNWEMNSGLLRYRYSSLTIPESTYDYDMETREGRLLKRIEVLGGYSSDEYRSLRLHATATDGVRVPLSIVYRKDLRTEGTSPLLLYGYGAYGSCVSTDFDPARVSLLDRGFVYAIAHVRGGQELGRSWYEDGKLLRKKNTFTDFIACAEYLTEGGFSEPGKMFAMGGSAGGLLMGAVVNMRPDLFKGVIATVPWVDVVTTMLDHDIPLTTSEFDEWGNPEQPEYYRYMLSYSPYDNIEAKGYPNLYVTAGLEDSQVQYWEPAKWVAKLRSLKTDDNLLVLQTDMEAGHGGPSGRFKQYRAIARRYAFMLGLLHSQRAR